MSSSVIWEYRTSVHRNDCLELDRQKYQLTRWLPNSVAKMALEEEEDIRNNIQKWHIQLTNGKESKQFPIFDKYKHINTFNKKVSTKWNKLSNVKF